MFLEDDLQYEYEQIAHRRVELEGSKELLIKYTPQEKTKIAEVTTEMDLYADRMKLLELGVTAVARAHGNYSEYEAQMRKRPWIGPSRKMSWMK